MNFKKQLCGLSVVFFFVIIISTGCTQQIDFSQVSDDNLPRLGRPDQLTVGNYGSGYSYTSDRDYDPAELIKKYEAVIKDLKDSDQKYNYMQQMVDYYDLFGEREKAIHYLEILLQVDDVYIQNEAREKLARVYYESREFEKGLQVLDELQISDSSHTNLKTQMLKGDLYCGLGQYEKGREAYQAVLTPAETYSPENIFHYKVDVEQQLKKMEWYQQDRGVTIQGTVTADDKPAPKIRVGVRHGFTTGPFEPQFIEITDEGGHYSFKDLPLGDYQVYMELDLNRWKSYYTVMELNGQKSRSEKIGVDAGEYQFDFRIVSPIQLMAPKSGRKARNPQVTFKWEEHPDAAYYVVSFGYRFKDENGRFALHAGIPNTEERVENNRLTFDLTRLNQPSVGESYSTSYIEVDQILGTIYPGAEITWQVTAYDQDEQILSNSTPQGQQIGELTHIVIDFGRLEPGDRELIRYEYIAALDLYLDEYEKKQERAVAEKIRKVVDGLYFMYQYDYDEKIDVDRFIRVAERAADLFPEYKMMNTLGNLLFGQEQYNAARDVFLKMIDLQLETTEIYELLAMIELQTANYSNSRTYWEQTNAVGYKLAYQLLTGQEMNIGPSWQELEAQLLQLSTKLDIVRLDQFYHAINQNQQKQVEEMLKGDDLTSCYLNLLWKLVTVYRPWDDYDLRQEIYLDSQELINLMSLTEKEEQVLLKFVGFWLG